VCFCAAWKHSLENCTVAGVTMHSQWSVEQISESTSMRPPILQLSCSFWQNLHKPGPSVPLHPRFGSLRLLVYPKAQIAIEIEEICECDGHTVRKLSQRRLTADWLAPRASECSRMGSKFSCDWLRSYMKTTRSVLEIFKMAEYFPGRPPMSKIRHFKYCCTVSI
jgi:hypothetical protein